MPQIDILNEAGAVIYTIRVDARLPTIDKEEAAFQAAVDDEEIAPADRSKVTFRIRPDEDPPPPKFE